MHKRSSLGLLTASARESSVNSTRLLRVAAGGFGCGNRKKNTTQRKCVNDLGDILDLAPNQRRTPLSQINARLRGAMLKSGCQRIDVAGREVDDGRVEDRKAITAYGVAANLDQKRLKNLRIVLLGRHAN